MKEKLKIDDRIWEFVGDNLNIINPSEVTETFDKSDKLLFEFQLNGIKKGLEFSEKDYNKLTMELSSMDRTNDVIELNHIYKRGLERDSILDGLYHNDNSFKNLINTEDVKNIKVFLKDIYERKIGHINDDILEVDAHYMIDKIKRNTIIDKLLED